MLYKKWNKKPCISEKMASLKVRFKKIKKTININEVDIKEIVLSHKKSYGKDSFKYFIGYRHQGNASSSPLCVKHPQMNASLNILIKVVST